MKKKEEKEKELDSFWTHPGGKLVIWLMNKYAKLNH